MPLRHVYPKTIFLLLILASIGFLLCSGSDFGKDVFEGEFAVSCPDGFGELLDPQYFEVFGAWQNRYGRDSLRMSSHFLGIFNEKIGPVVDEAIAKCPAYVLEVMMNAVLAIETHQGMAAAREWLLQINALKYKASRTATPANQKRLDTLMDEWAVDIAAVYPKFLDVQRLGPFPSLPVAIGSSSASIMQDRDEVDFCFGQRFYSYVLDEQFYAPGNFYCLQGQWGTEVILRHYFRQTCNTQDPEIADWFYVPLYATCLYVKLNENVSDDDAMMEDMDYRSNVYIWEPLFAFLKGSKYFERKQGKDHIFLFADGQGPRIWDSYEAIRSESVFLSPESKCPTWKEPVRHYLDIKPCLSSWKDTIIPGHTDYARIEYMRKHNKPSEERNLLMTFHGRAPGLHDAYGDCAVRGSIMKMASHGPHVDVGGFVGDYLERKGDSHFCLVPAGTSPWTNHLYESFYAGCIPVILSDEYEVAFAEELDWPSFSIKWPEAETGDKLHEYLVELSQYFPQKIVQMKESLERHACWFNWYSTDVKCNPYLLIQRRLKRLLDRRSARARYWSIDQEKLGNPDEPPLVFAHQRRLTRFKAVNEENASFKYLDSPEAAR